MAHFKLESKRFSHSMCYFYSCFGRSSPTLDQFQVKSLTAQMAHILPCKKPAGIISTFRLTTSTASCSFGVFLYKYSKKTQILPVDLSLLKWNPNHTPQRFHTHHPLPQTVTQYKESSLLLDTISQGVDTS
jgi:hypothetical protein